MFEEPKVTLVSFSAFETIAENEVIEQEAVSNGDLD